MVYKFRELGINLIHIRYNNRRLRLIVFLAIAVIIVVSLALFVKNVLSGAGENQQADSRFSIPDAKARIEIQREFSFPLKDNKGEEISTIKYTILDAQLQDQIISKGKNYTTVKGRTILILNLKIANEFSQSISINTRDYIRLSVNSSGEWLAADIHNDPVSIQAISTKYTRLGFPIYDSDKDLKLQIGEINGEKEIIDLNF